VNVVLNELGITHTGTTSNAWVNASINGKTMVIDDRGVKEQTGVVPNVKGMGLRDALYLLENCGLKVNVNGEGRVISQSIHADTEIKKGDEITITMSL